MSDTEQRELEERIRLSGMQKQDFLIKSSLQQRIIVVGNRLMFRKMDELLSDIKDELVRIGSEDEIGDDLLSPLRTVLDLLDSFENIERALLSSQD